MRILLLLFIINLISVSLFSENLYDSRKLNEYGEFKNKYNYESLYKNEVLSFCEAVGVRPVGKVLEKIHVGGGFRAIITDPVKLDRVCRHSFFYQLATILLIKNSGNGFFEFHNLRTAEFVKIRQDIDILQMERQLGILPDTLISKPPWKEGYTFRATVLEPQKLRRHDFYGNRRGDRITVICTTRLRWRLLNERTDIERDVLYFFGKWVTGWEFL